MKPLTLQLAVIATQHWFLQLLLFGLLCFGVEGPVSLLFTVMAWVASTPVYLAYPILLRAAAVLQCPRLGLLIVLVALLAANDWLFTVLSAPDEFSTDRFFYWGGYHDGEGLPLRASVWAATILSTIALRLPITDYLRTASRRASAQS